MSTENLEKNFLRPRLKGGRGVRGLVKALAAVPDFRRAHLRKHPLVNILVIALMSYLSGWTGTRDMEAFGVRFRDWLEGFLDLSNGIPDHTTFARVLRRLPPRDLAAGVGAWLRACAGDMRGAVVSFDGKAMRRAADAGGRAPHIETAWVDDAGVAVGSLRVGTKENEIVAAPELARGLSMAGAVATFDAMGCQREIAAECRRLGAHYMMPLKGNQPAAYAEVLGFMLFKRREEPRSLSYSAKTEKGHGRVEIRRAWYTRDIGWFEDKSKWAGLAGFVMIETTRIVGGKRSKDTRCYLTSLRADARTMRRIARRHWGVENRLHWVLDDVFGEDRCRARRGFAPENVNALGKMALMLLRRNGGGRGVKECRRDCAWDCGFALRVLTGEGEEVMG